jgi:ribonuclease D
MTINLYKGDLPAGLDFGSAVAVDCETMGLNLVRDRLCLIQLSAGDGNAHLVQFPRESAFPFNAPNLAALLADSRILKLFHFGRFDLAAIERYLGVMAAPVYCTKIASKLCRTSTDRHSLKDLVKEFLGVDLSKVQQTSDWGVADLSQDQLTYAASDVLYLHGLKTKLDELLKREGRMDVAEACFRFLPHRARLDLLGWDDEHDIFSHH